MHINQTPDHLFKEVSCGAHPSLEKENTATKVLRQSDLGVQQI